MSDYQILREKVNQLAARSWDVKSIEARIKKTIKEDIPKKKLNPKAILASRVEILDRVQQHAEENNYFLKNCAQATALALMEEFGLGSMDVIKALTPFPSIAGTGRICGGITGSLIALGLFFGPDNPPNSEKMSQVIKIAQKFIVAFEKEIGYLNCSDILEKVILGHKLNPGESDAAMALFTSEKGFEKCGLPPGTGNRLAAGIIIGSMRKNGKT